MGKKLNKYEVVVGNIGTVYAGFNAKTARTEYDDYVLLSKLGVGRAGNEPVTLFLNDDIEEDYEGRNS